MFYTPKPQRLLIKAAAFLLMLFATSASCKTTKEHPLRSQNPNLPDPYGANQHINWVELNDGVEYALLENQFETDVHIVKIDLKNPNLKIVVSPEAEKGSNPLEHALNADAYVSLNAAFFDGAFNPRGIAISNGTKWNSTLYPESSPFIFCDIKNICGINHKGSDSIESTWYNAVGGYHSLVSLRKMRTRQDDLNCGSFCTNSHP
jgi:hypothetical protein